MQEAYKNLSLEDMDGEVWKPVVGYEGLYEVSSFGRVKSCERIIFIPKMGFERNIISRILKIKFDKRGYVRVALSKEGLVMNYFVHRLVAAAFLSNPERKQTVNHINGIHDDNRVGNIEWATQAENNQHAWSSGIYRRDKPLYNIRGLNNPNSNLTREQIIEIRSLSSVNKLSCAKIAAMYNVCSMSIWKIITRKSYTDVE